MNNLIGLIFCIIIGCFFIGLGIYCFISKKEAGFWANTSKFSVKDMKAYNRAVGTLWCVYGLLFIPLSLPMMKGQNSPYIVISILGIVFESIIAVVVYVLVIERKYRSK